MPYEWWPIMLVVCHDSIYKTSGGCQRLLYTNTHSQIVLNLVNAVTLPD